MSTMQSPESGAVPAGGFHWDDPIVYRWSRWSTNQNVAGLVGYMLGVVIFFPAIILFILWLISRWSEQGAYWIGLGVTALFLATTVFHIWQKLFGKRVEQIQAHQIIYSCAVATIGAILYVLVSPHSHLAPSFQDGANAGLWQWLLFLMDTTLSVVLFNIPESSGIHFSGIFLDGALSRITTAILRILIVIGIVEFVLTMYRTHFQKGELFHTVEECYWACEGLPEVDGVMVCREGAFNPFPQPETLSASAFLEALKEHANKTTS